MAAVRRSGVPQLLVDLADLLRQPHADAARIVTAAVASHVRGILLEAAAALKRHYTAADR